MISLDDLIASPAVLPIERVGDLVRILRLDEAAYAHASFLDQRLLQGVNGRDAAWIPWIEVRQAAARLQARAHFVFHIGHVGSTLLSRLLGSHDAVFSLREPAVLRQLALAGAAASETREDLAIWLRLLSRTWRPRQHAVIKATSFVSELAEDLLLLAAPEARGIVLGMSPPNYLRVILGGANSRRESKALAGPRRSRLQSRLGVPVHATSEGECIAMSWLCETLCLHQTAGRSGDRLMWLDFDRLLADPADALRRAFDHLAIAVSQTEIVGFLNAGVMRRYSKGPEHAYDADLRRQVMAQAGREHAAQVHAGMAWLQQMACSHPLVRETLVRAAAAAQPIGGPTANR